jgi:uncharacterized membrane protein YjgN (DUF898 family)
MDAPNYPPASTAVPSPVSVPSIKPVVLGWLEPMGMIGLSIFNFVMRLLTLGVYHFWGKTEVRKRIWSAIRLDAEPLEYTGTGRELLLGFLVVFGVVLLPLGLASFVAAVAFGPQSMGVLVVQGLVYLLFYLLLGVGTHRAQRYRLARTRWRGIRGGLGGSSWRYGLAHFLSGLLIPVTLGWIVPWRTTYLQRLMTRDMRFGNLPFTFNATSGPLYARYLLVWLGTMFTVAGAAILMTHVARTSLAVFDPTSPRGYSYSPAAVAMLLLIAGSAYLLYGVFSAWYRASQIRHFASHTHLGGAHFTSTVTAGGLIWLTLTNFLLVVLSLGMLTPVAQVRAARYYIQHASLEGAIALGTIAPGARDDFSKGEGLAQAFDVDAF